MKHERREKCLQRTVHDNTHQVWLYEPCLGDTFEVRAEDGEKCVTAAVVGARGDERIKNACSLSKMTEGGVCPTQLAEAVADQLGEGPVWQCEDPLLVNDISSDECHVYVSSECEDARIVDDFDFRRAGKDMGLFALDNIPMQKAILSGATPFQ